jgi:hypothetical protein
MRSVVVEDNMDVLTLRDPVLNYIEELAEFNAAVTPVAFANHFAGSCYNGPRKLDNEIRWKDGPGPS